MVNSLSRRYHNYSNEILTFLFFSGFLICLIGFFDTSPPPTSDGTSDITWEGSEMFTIWGLLTIVFFLLGCYYFLNSVSRLMDKYEPSFSLTPTNRVRFYLINYFGILLIIFYQSYVKNGFMTTGFYRNAGGGLYFLQLILFLMAVGTLFTYLSRPKTAISQAYAGELGLEFQKPSSKRFISNPLIRSLTKNMIVLFNLGNFFILIVISFLGA